MSCIYEVVCKYSIENNNKECVLIDICKFIPAASEVRSQDYYDEIKKKQKTAKVKKRTYKKREKLDHKKTTPKEKKTKHAGKARANYQHLTTSDKDVVRALMIVKLRRRRGALSENQSAALAMYDGIRVNKLAEHQRQQILNILNDSEK